jgi:hypothetical protein
MTITETIASGDVAALNYFIAEKYLKAFGQLAESPNQKVLMLPIETAGVLATLGGIAKIAKHSFRDGAVGPPSPRQPLPPAPSPAAAPVADFAERRSLAVREPQASLQLAPQDPIFGSQVVIA